MIFAWVCNDRKWRQSCIFRRISLLFPPKNHHFYFHSKLRSPPLLIYWFFNRNLRHVKCSSKFFLSINQNGRLAVALTYCKLGVSMVAIPLRAIGRNCAELPATILELRAILQNCVELWVFLRVSQLRACKIHLRWKPSTAN